MKIKFSTAFVPSRLPSPNQGSCDFADNGNGFADLQVRTVDPEKTVTNRGVPGRLSPLWTEIGSCERNTIELP